MDISPAPLAIRSSGRSESDGSLREPGRGLDSHGSIVSLDSCGRFRFLRYIRLSLEAKLSGALISCVQVFLCGRLLFRGRRKLGEDRTRAQRPQG